MADKKNILDIVKGLQQAAANAYDGAKDDEGKPIKTGLRREEGDFLSGNRLLDGFNVKFQGNKMVLSYHSEILMKELHDKKFEDNILATIEDAVKWLKKEYKSITGESVKLKMDGKPDFRVENTSRIRSWVTVQCVYTVNEMKDTKEKRQIDSAIKDWLAQGKSKSEGFK